MKNFFTSMLVLILLMLQISLVNAADGVNIKNQGKHIAIVILSDEFQKDKHYSYAKEIPESNPQNIVEIGRDTQEKYACYCLNNGLDMEAVPKLNDLTSFAEEENFDRLLFLVVKKPNVEISHVNAYTGVGNSIVKKARVSLQVDAFLCDKTKLLKTFSVTKKRSSQEGAFDNKNPEARAKSSAFKLCTKAIGEAMKGLL